MSDDNGVFESEAVTHAAETAYQMPDPNREPAPPINSRFLYVDVAAQRAKQLRRGALPRLEDLVPDPETGVRPVPNSKLERIAMREVDLGKVYYEVPDAKPAGKDAA